MSTWRVALREQARSDFLAADVLATEEGHASQTTMLLQMAWEKLAKAALVMSGAWDPTKKSHKVAAKFASVLKKAPRIEEVLRSPSRAAVAGRLTWLQVELETLEALAPALATSENAEYPWVRRGSGTASEEELFGAKDGSLRAKPEVFAPSKRRTSGPVGPARAAVFGARGSSRRGDRAQARADGGSAGSPR